MKRWMIGITAAIAILVLDGYLDDSYEQEKIASDDLKAAQRDEEIARQEIRHREAYFNHLLSLDRVKK